MKGGIYTIRFIGSDKFYIGKTKNFRKRWSHHAWCLRVGVHHNTHLQSVFNRLSEAALMFQIEERIDDDALRTVREQSWLDCFADSPFLLNQTMVSVPESTFFRVSASRIAWNKGIPSPRRGLPRSEEERQAISAATVGKKKPRIAQVTEETRRRMSEAQTGRVMTVEARAAMSRSRIGKKFGPRSDEVRAKISAANKGRIFSDAHRAALRAAKAKAKAVA